MTDIFRGVGVEIELGKPDDFLKVKETLTRVGVASSKENTLYQSCHILHKRGRYAILHFKEFFILDGMENNFTEEDTARRNTIVNLLEEWGLVRIIDKESAVTPLAPLGQIKILTHKEKGDWNLVTKYMVGSKRKVTR